MMSQSAAPVIENSVPAAWSRITETIRHSGEGAVANLLVEVTRPTRDLPGPLKDYASQIRGWATQLQSVTPQLLPFTHGQRLRRWSVGRRANFPSTRFDQIEEFVVPMLIRNPRTKRAVCFVGHPAEDARITDEPIPALELVQFRLQDDSLSCTAYFRAQEMYFFWVVNVFELIELQEHVCRSITSRMPQMEAVPGSITTISFTAYINVSDLEEKTAFEQSQTLAIERLQFSSMRSREFNRLLTSALIRAESDSIATLMDILEADFRKLNRIRDLNLDGLRRLQAFLDENRAKVNPTLQGLQNVAKSALSSLVNLDTYLEQDRSPSEIHESIAKVRASTASLLQTLRQAQHVGPPS